MFLNLLLFAEGYIAKIICKDWEDEENILKIVIDKSIIEKIQFYLKSKNKSHRSVYPDLKGEYLDVVDSSAGTYFLRGYINNIKKNYQTAILNYTKVIKLSPNNVNAYNNRGNAYAKQKPPNFKAAIKDFIKARELGAKDLYEDIENLKNMIKNN